MIDEILTHPYLGGNPNIEDVMVQSGRWFVKEMSVKQPLGGWEVYERLDDGGIVLHGQFTHEHAQAVVAALAALEAGTELPGSVVGHGTTAHDAIDDAIAKLKAQPAPLLRRRTPNTGASHEQHRRP